MKRKIDLFRVPTNALWKELERRSSKEYLRRVRAEYRGLRKLALRGEAVTKIDIPPVVHCWEEGPEICRHCGAQECATHSTGWYSDNVGSLCMLAEGHKEPHDWTPKNEITLQFADTELDN